MRVIYLKSLFNKDKPNKKAIKLINEAIVKANGVNPEVKREKPLGSREFILRHTEDFLDYAISYSLDEKVKEHYSK